MKNIEIFNLAENNLNYFVNQIQTIANLKGYQLMQANITIFLKNAA